MKSQQIIALVAILLVVGAGIWFFTQNNTIDESMSDGASNPEARDASLENENDSFSGVGSFAQLMARGNSFRCDFEVDEEDNTSSGTVFFDGKGERFAATGEYSDQGERGTFGIITTDGTSYIWGSSAEGVQGIKVTMPEGSDFESNSSFESETYASSPVGMNDNVSYDCDSWRVDASVFVPPSDVTFTDMQKMMEDMMGSMPEGFQMPEDMPVFVQ